MAMRRTQEPQCTPQGKRMLSGWLSSTTTRNGRAGLKRWRAMQCSINGQDRW